MNLKEFKIVDTNFAHASYTTDFQTSKYFNWSRNLAPNNDLVVFTDNSMFRVNNITSTKKIGMLMEPRVINSNSYNWVNNNYNLFDKILTYDKNLLSSINNGEFYPHGGCWIKTEDQLIHNKNKLISIIASNKRQAVGHNLRHNIIDECNKNNINLDIYGRGYNPVEYKLDALKDYSFSIVVENSKLDYYFTEKLIDSFITGTVPIYWGCPSIGDFFNLEGMIIIEDLDSLLNKLKTLSLDEYNDMLPAIKENFEKAKKFLIAEDWIYENTKIFK